MRKMNKFTLDFINKNIKTNTQASSFPVRKQQDIKIIPQDIATPNAASAKVFSTTTGSPIIKTA
ncbi:hypothetical protein [Colwellia sp. PAMC 21821]|uniref:hypothetical protein n=1 Tax=Colwellia sp. PAMC 21821 TaxID=1816219 RepID=UPI0009BD835E|nr:hypothetical protein [Colwellia sp. PAMC 21821]ARD42942.1 hypothetical protein A3Q33_00505 [Colwellia sp. PAMC 21821]